MVQETSIGGTARDFPQTRWTMILTARDPAARRRALEDLLTRYWKPLYFFVRRKGHGVEPAKDIVQGFFLHLLDRDFVSRLDPGKGRLRAYLRTALEHYLINLYEAESARKRGGGSRHYSLDFEDAERNLGSQTDSSPEQAYEREWALGVLERSLTRLKREYEDGMRHGPFEIILKFFRPGVPPSYAEASAACGMTETRFKAFLHRARARFRDLVRREIRDVVGSEDQVDPEITELFHALRS